MPRLLPLWIALAILAPASVRSAEPALPTSAKPDPQELVIGDYYHGTVNRQQATHELRGYLVHMTDDWLVLGQIRTQGQVHGVPWVSELPYLGAMFREVEIVPMKILYWIPRSSITMTGRETFPKQAGFEDFRGVVPKLTGDCEICLSIGEIDAITGHLSGELKEIDGESLTLATYAYEVKKTESRWSNLPIIGGMFTSQELVRKQVDRKVPLDDVFVIWQQSPFEATQKQ